MQHPVDPEVMADRITLAIEPMSFATMHNDHLGARIHLAEAIKHEPALRILRACKEIHGIEMHMSDELNLIVRRWTDNMLKWLGHHHPNQVARVRRCL